MQTKSIFVYEGTLVENTSRGISYNSMLQVAAVTYRKLHKSTRRNFYVIIPRCWFTIIWLFTGFFGSHGNAIYYNSRNMFHFDNE